MNFERIPEELRQLPRWVCWTMAERDGKPTKVPINPLSGGNAMSNNPDTWTDYWTALDTMTTGGHAGIGFMFNGDGVVGVDIDHCRDPNTGALNETAKDIITILDSYTEISQSGTGMHIICRGAIPGERRRKDPVEMYETGRYFCMTGNVLDEAHMDVEERQAELAVVHEKYINIKKQGKNEQKSSKNANDTPVFANDDDIVSTALAAKNGDLFASLMNGSWQGTYTSQSEADLALCNLLAFYTGNDTAAMDRIFRRSGLFRDKWTENRGEGGSYGNITIHRAIADCQNSYTPKKRREEKSKPEAPPAEVPEIETGFDQLGELAPEQLPEWIYGPYSDMWNAERFVEHFGKDLRFNTGKGCWHIWNGQCWIDDRLGKIRNMVDAAMQALYRYEPLMAAKLGTDHRKYKDFFSWVARCRNTSRRNNIVIEAQNWEGVSMVPEDFDNNQWLFNCRNGTIDLRTGKLKPFERTDLITRFAPADYDPAATAPTWEKFLDRIFDGKKPLIEFIQRAVGYTLTGSIREQSMFVCHGSGANGKSTLIGIIQDLIGEYSRNTNFSTFTIKNDSNTNDIARLVGARMVTAMEVSENKWLNAALVKQLTGGDKISARFLHKEFFDFVPTFKIWMGVNHKPGIHETDHGTWRRIKLIPFDVTIPDNEKDEELPQKLRAEFPGILAWAVRGCLDWQRDGLAPPPEVSTATEKYRNEMDVFQAFLDECVEKAAGLMVTAKSLYIVYSAWSDENGMRSMSSTKFSIKMQEKGFERDRTKISRYWKDIQLSETGNNILSKKSSWKQPSDEKGDAYEQDELPWQQ